MKSRLAAVLGTRRSYRLTRAVAALLGALILAALSVLTVLPARADTAVSPKAGVFTLYGAGYGHGWGMSQYGAYGAATKGLTWQQIMAFYYPGTTLATRSVTATIRVWITEDTDNDLRVLPSSGLKVSDTNGHSYTMPTGTGYRAWRAVVTSTTMKLQYRNADGDWVTRTTTLTPGTWTFSNTAKIVKVWLTDGTYREFRGTVSGMRIGTTTSRTVNTLTMEQYLQSVVPSELPTSWHPEAVRSQAVAARTYAARLQASAATGATYDVCDTTACQVYKGYAITSGGVRTLQETAAGNAAVSATAGRYLAYGSTVALTQFSSSNGGYAAQGDYPYLPAHPDPYDAVIKPNTWTATLTTTAIAAAYPAVGTVRQLQVLSRDGYGRWGGRVESIKIIGSTTSQTVTGMAFRTKLALRSTLFTITGGVGTPYETFPRRYDPSSLADLLMVTNAGNLVRRPALPGGTLGDPVQIGTGGWTNFTHVVNAGDWNGDGYQDVIARTTGERLLLYRGRSTGGFSAGVDMGLRSNHTELTSVGDFNGDTFPDLVVVNVSGNLYICWGNGSTGFTGFTRLATGWGDQKWLRSPGDWNSDGRPDLITRVGTDLYLHKGTATNFSSPVRIGTGWGSIATITSIGDFDADGHADLVAKTVDSKFRLYPGNGNGGFLPMKPLAGTWSTVYAFGI
ncbi:hypothetical protein GCM10009841_25710 [Microlunatus panaciterrae]|uniref:SpoIID/LytB domain protein n=1 Tax=Microlunatus panaciterrae TaxID=400768 RepID=A0ABS2RFD3_9ACTN|nr:SpoIID/LytB domain-containing protein [Microlunatus panaciterrae]MBM7797453.1 SpoIID/LytB domain protein [Microlunatus panaciterrae]